MKKGKIVLICLMIILALGAVILPFFFSKGATDNNYSSSSWTHEVTVKDGIVTPGSSTSDFTIYKDGSYRIEYGWMPEGLDKNRLTDIPISDVHFLTVIQIFDSKGEQIFSTCGGYIFADTVLELTAGQYRAIYTYFTDRGSFIEFAKENLCPARQAEQLAEDVGFGSYGGDAVVRMDYEMSRVTMGDDPLFALWIFVIILLILTFTVFLAVTKGRGDFDERQQLERGKAYCLGFMTILVSMFLAITIDILKLLPVQGYVLCAASIFPGLMVFVAYCVWHEAYFSLKDKEKSLLIFFGFIGVINLIITITSILDGRMIENGKLSFSVLNLVCAVMFIELFVIVLLKKISTSKETDEEDED
ncbi:MAG: hypothetical protein K5697_03770 [Lachnospiraceae bacterium]|nr:hypothetical protein [Lachnospiraceae bacterium]